MLLEVQVVVPVLPETVMVFWAIRFVVNKQTAKQSKALMAMVYVMVVN